MKHYFKEGMIDSHFHILEMNKKGLSSDKLLQYYQEKGLTYLLDASVDLFDFEKRLEYRQFHTGLFFAAGIHPNIPRQEWPREYDKILLEQGQNPLVKAIGETGLDFYRTYSNKKDQIDLLELHYEVASAVSKPLIFHCRNAENELKKWMLEKDFPFGGVLHCFPGNEQLGKTALDKGLMISFAGNFTFKNAHDIRNAVKWVPIERVLVETDAPYLSPAPWRGTNNHPGHIGHSYEAVAEEYGISVDDLIKQVEQNFKKFLTL